jgi:hypothetical protein
MWRDLSDRLWTRVEPNGDCWEFTGARNAKGYGSIGVGNRRTTQAHRVAYEVTYGPIPPGALVLHSCDNPPCVNPAHLRIGTAADNTADMMERQRNVAPRSLHNGKAKLSDEDVAAIRQRHATGESCKAIARDLNLHSTYVSRIIRGLRRVDSQKATV